MIEPRYRVMTSATSSSVIVVLIDADKHKQIKSVEVKEKLSWWDKFRKKQLGMSFEDRIDAAVESMLIEARNYGRPVSKDIPKSVKYAQDLNCRLDYMYNRTTFHL